MDESSEMLERTLWRNFRALLLTLKADKILNSPEENLSDYGKQRRVSKFIRIDYERKLVNVYGREENQNFARFCYQVQVEN